MEQVHIDTLKKFEKEIIDNVFVYNGIIKPLRIENILKEEDVNAIVNGTNTREEQISKLLDILTRCGPFAFSAFINSLKHHYSWISNKIERHLENSNMSGYNRSHTNDLPSCPRFTVTRKELEFFWTMRLKHLLHLLRPGGHLAVYGLRGIGKTCLIAKTLKEDKNLVAELFHNEIYWMNFDYNNLEDKKIEDEISNQLNALYQKFNCSVHPTRQNSESLKDCFIRFIRNYLNKREHQNALLILDNVTNELIVNNFNFGCKTLIITDDFSVVKKMEPLELEISSGFTETESLSLFAKMLDVTGNLPNEAKQIHKQCKGLPGLIGMMVGQFKNFKEQMVQDPTCWKYFLKKLNEEENYMQTVRGTFNLCIDKLQPDERKYFYELAVFNDDINIMPMTLEILWDMEPCAVIDLMTIFNYKTLATKQWNQELNSYIYGIHNMLLDHLRSELGPEALRAKHEALIEKYKIKCNGDFSQLPLDNYIHSFIGHHLEKAKLFHLFDKIYLDLKFIEKKIIHSGVNNLLVDIEKYKEYIINNNADNRAKLNSLETFIRANVKNLTKHREKRYLNIIQLALLDEGLISNLAREVAIQTKTEHPYYSRKLFFDNEINVENIFTECMTYSLSENITNLCFTNKHNSLLWSTENGDIVQRNFNTGQIYNFYDLKGENIKKLIVSNNNHFLALTQKGDVKLFLLDENDLNGEKNYKYNQSQYIALFDNKKNDVSLKTFRLNNEIIEDVIFTNDDLIAACTQQGTVILWHQNGNQICRINKNKDSLKKIISSNSLRNELFHTFTNKGILVTYIFDNNRLDDISMYDPLRTNLNRDVDIIFCQQLITETNSLIVITKEKAIYLKWEQSEGVLENIRVECEIMNNSKETFENAIITYDEQYLIIVKSNGCTEIWNIRNEFKLVTSCNWKVSSLDTFWMKNENYHLLCGKENSLIYKWKLNPKIEELTPVREPLFNAFMKPKGQNDIVAHRTIDNKLIITEGNHTSWKTKSEIDLQQKTISKMIFSKDGKKLIYDIIENQKQTIFLLDINSGISKYIIKLKNIAKFIWPVNNFTVSNIVIIVEENQELKICIYSNEKITTHIVKNFGSIIGVHEIDTNQILTVTKDCNITYWMVDPNSGELLFKEDENSKIKVIKSTMSKNKTYLGILTKNRKQILIYQIKNTQENENETQAFIKFYHKIPQFNAEVTCFEFSTNEKYLAIGFKNGNISIYDMKEKMEIYTAPLNLSCVKNLIWNLDSSILMLENLEEIALLKTPRKIQPVKLNRKGMCINTKIVDSFNQKIMAQSKTDQSLLLRIIPNNTAKVCVSEDFEKILTVDNNGYINIFTPLMISQINKTLKEKCSAI